MSAGSQEKRAVVTGASSGIGRSTALALAAEGWRVMAVARRGDRLDELQRTSERRIAPLALDICAAGAADRVATAAQEQFGGLDLLVNNAGMSWLGEFAAMPEQKIDELLDLNVRALMRLCRACIPMLERSSGQIINIGSVAAHMPMSTIAVYCATKAAVVTFSRVLARELGPKRIRVNCFSPGGTDTELFEKVGAKVDASQLAPPDQQAQIVLELTRLPARLDVLEVMTDQRFNPLVL